MFLQVETTRLALEGLERAVGVFEVQKRRQGWHSDHLRRGLRGGAGYTECLLELEPAREHGGSSKGPQRPS